MANGLADYGWKDIDWTFGLENNEVHSTFYIKNDTELESLLDELFGGDAEEDSEVYLPMPHPRWKSFYATDVNIRALSVIGNDDGQSNWRDSINQNEGIAGGFNVMVTFKPMTSCGSHINVTDENMEFSAQIMSVISNSPAADTKYSIKWKGGSMDGKNATNLRGINMVIPKLTVYQKRVVAKTPPSLAMQKCIGTVNSQPFSLIGLDANPPPIWQPGCVLCSSIPAQRRFRYDGQPCWEYGIKLEVLTVQGKLEDGTLGYVTWNRLWNMDANPPCWNLVTYADGTPIYPLDVQNGLDFATALIGG